MADSPRITKLFTVQQANAMLPLVRAICTDLSQLADDVKQRRDRLGRLLAGRDVQRGDPYDEELAQVKEDLAKDFARVEEHMQELIELGVYPKGNVEGLVDFPAVVDGRTVFLCWKLGEPEVLFWHELNAGYAERQPLTAETAVPVTRSVSEGNS